MRKNIWLVQKDLVNQNYPNNLNDFDILQSLGVDVIQFTLIPFENKIIGLENLNVSEDVNYIVRAGTNVIRLLAEENDSLILNKIKSDLNYSVEAFDQNHYSSIPELPCINKNSRILDLSIGSDLYASFSEDKFIKPTSDLKAFDAGILEQGQTVKDFIENRFHHKDYQKQTALVSDLKNIIEEYRFFFLKNEIVGASRYFVNGRLNTSISVPDRLFDTAKKYAKIYSPSILFALDLGILDDGNIEIVEYNCFSASGTYAIDRSDMFNRINKL